MNKILDFIRNGPVLLDGGMGTLLQQAGLAPGERPECWNLTHPSQIIQIHESYFNAGSNVVNTNTFGANSLKFSDKELADIIRAAMENAREARARSTAPGEKFIALDIGPTGRLLKPFGDLDFEEAVSVFAKTVRLGVQNGAELIFIETMNDSYETKAALLAAKENSSLPVFVSNAYGENGRLMTGAFPAAMVALLEGMGADAIGVNCSFGPQALMPVIEEYLRLASVPVFFKPNAGMPQFVNGRTVYDVEEEEFSSQVASAMEKGVRIVGGCCGTTPAYIERLCALSKRIAFEEIAPKNDTLVSSYSQCVRFGEFPVLIGERINPTGKKLLKKALLENDLDVILNEGIRQQENGAHILDVNVGLPEIDEIACLKNTVRELQAVTDLPLQIDTSDPQAMEAALRIYNGKPLINSVNGKEKCMEEIFPLVKKYGGVVVALTLDENGIPETAEGRFQIAEKILATAQRYGIAKKDIIFDTLTMTVSALPSAARVTLDALKMIRQRLGCHTSLGVSNVSFGLPAREAINGVFFGLALENGLSAAILNPGSAEMMKTYRSFLALNGMDPNCGEYIRFASGLPAPVSTAAPREQEQETRGYDSALQQAVIKGLKEKAAQETKLLLKSTAPLAIVNREIIPALDEIGKAYEEKRAYLPQLLMSAEAANAAFELVKAETVSETHKAGKKCGFVIATVQGDIHDIGKNIVKLLLENYGFEVWDLGKDVPPERIAEKVLETRAPLVGLSALMTTTVPAMAETITLLRKKAKWCKIVVGGAVLNADTAKSIGADQYAKDAMETVRYAEKVHEAVKG